MQVCPYTVTTQQGKPRLLFRACSYSSGLIRRGLCGLWRCYLHLKLRHYCRFFRLKALTEPTPDLTPQATKVMARSLGRAMYTLVVQERHLWLCLVDIGMQWAVRERHQRLLTHPLPNYGSRSACTAHSDPSSVHHGPGPCVPPHCPTAGMSVFLLAPLVRCLGAGELPSHLAGSCGTSDSAMRFSSPGVLPSSGASTSQQ